MKKLVVLFIAVIVLSIVSGCTMAKISTKGAKPVLMNQPQQTFDVIQHIRVELPIRFDFTSSFEMDQVIANALKEHNGDAVINVRVEVKVTPSDYFLNVFTCGIANAKTAVMEGDVVKWN